MRRRPLLIVAVVAVAALAVAAYAVAFGLAQAVEELDGWAYAAP